MQRVLGRARSILRPIPAPISSPFHRSSSLPRSVFLFCLTSTHRPFSSLPDLDSDKKNELFRQLFSYTSGRWFVNEELRLAERKRVFNIIELCRLAAESVDRTLRDVKEVVKLCEGDFHRDFEIRMHDGFKMVARTPYTFTAPKFYAVASEVATMCYLRSSGIPIQQVYDYSPSPDNAAETEYIFMEYLNGINLGNLWMEMEESAKELVLRQLVQLEARMMEIKFPAGGSLYYTKDLEEVGGKAGVLLEDENFCVGVDARFPMWQGRRSQADVDRGPYRTVEEALVAPARKEQAYLERFGRPLQPFRRERREHYDFKEQLPSDHLKNLDRYLRVAPSLIPRDPAFHRFCIRHPNLNPDNVVVWFSEETCQMEVVSLMNWHHASILPLFLQAGIPEHFNHDDMIAYFQAALPGADSNISEIPLEKINATQEYYNKFLHTHYIQHTKEYNKPNHEASIDPLATIIRRLFVEAGNPWMGETHQLQALLVQATVEQWEDLVGKGVPCPVVFGPDEVRETRELSEGMMGAELSYRYCQVGTGVRAGTWISNERYEASLEMVEEFTKGFFEGSAKDPDIQMKGLLEKVRVKGNWVFDDMDETDYN